MAEAETKKVQVVNIYGVRSALSPKVSEVYSIHVLIPSLNIEIRAVSLRYCEKKKRCWIMMPSKKGLIQGKTCHFPLVSFIDKKFQTELLREIRECFIDWRKTHTYNDAEVANEPTRKPPKPTANFKRPDYEPGLSKLFPRRNSKQT